MTSAELKHRVKLQEWAARIQDCRSSGLSVRAWRRQEEINAATYYRWEWDLLALAETELCSSVSDVRLAELPTPKQGSRNAAERSATLRDTCFGAESSANLTADTLEHGSVSAKARNSRSQR